MGANISSCTIERELSENELRRNCVLKVSRGSLVVKVLVPHSSPDASELPLLDA